MTAHRTGTRAEWLAARLELLEAEKELTRRSDELARRRQELPWVRVDKQYRFETDEGPATCHDLFRGRSQLLVYQFMFGPDYTVGCPACSAIADGFDGFIVHLANHDRVTHTLQQQRSGVVEYNFGTVDVRPSNGSAVADIAAGVGTDWATYTREAPGMSAFALEDGVVYHTYSAYARGLDSLWGMYQWLDRAPRGRNETGIWFRRHDEYGAEPVPTAGARRSA
jgi:predicted dithiol-disulfide oxidoreductase (DUF899 family)